MWDVLRPAHHLSRVDLRPLASDTRPARAVDAGHERVLRPGMFVDRASGLEAEHREEEVVGAYEHFPLDADTAFKRQRAPFRTREGLDLQFQTLTSR